ncbi:MAG: arylsulfatase [Verrucomicrobiae bacterium]|nr:arylsulfatase [Verrucomicrobiae bacterium]
MMNGLLRFVSGSLVALTLVSGSLFASERPNIVVIVADDMGFSDLGCYGGEIETPNLDALANGGLRFTNFYVNNMCWPTRASLMTGLYPKTALPRNGAAEGGLHPEATTLPQALREAGYATWMAGKWHLSDPAEPDGPNAPHHRGFDHFYGTIHGASDFFAPADLQLDGQSMTREWENNPDFYYTDAITDHALKFLEAHQTDSTSAERPFFLYVAYTAAHWPLHAKPEDIAHYEGRYAMGWDRLREQRHARMKELGVVDPGWPLSPRHPEVPAWEKAENPAWQQRRMEVYAAQITCMDRNIGRVIESLKATGQFENSLVLYHHDNGGCHVEYATDRTGPWSREFTTDGKHQPIRPGNLPGLMPGPQTTFQSYGYGWANASNTPFRLFKQYDHEGGTRSPLIVSWPMGLAPDLSGRLTKEVGHVIDLMPTLLDAAGTKSVVQNPFPFEGRSLLPILRGNPDELAPHGTLYWSHNRGRAIREGDWKLVGAEKNGPWELYQLDRDGTELNNLVEDEPERAKAMEQHHADWLKRTDLGGAKRARPKKP